MATFIYTIQKNRTTENGMLQAQTIEEAEKMLQDQGLSIINIREEEKKKKSGLFTQKSVKLIERVVFFDHLAQMMKAGLSLVETLDALKDDTENAYFKSIIQELKYDIETGNTLSSGMEKYPKVFPHLFIKMVEVGEISGTLEESARQIAVQVKKDYDLRSKVKGALIYPEILLGVMSMAGAGLLIFVIPQLSGFFKQAGLTLPLTTQFLIALSDFLRNDFLIVFIMIIASVFIYRYLNKNKKFVILKDTFLLKMPIIGPISHKLSIAIFARTLGSLLKSGVPIGKALDITADSATNSVYSKTITEFRDKVEKGEALSVAMQVKKELFTNLATRMVAVGDKTGTTPDMLFNVADFYQQQINETLGNISTIIEPVMLFIMGGATLFIALSVIVPIYQLTSGIAH